MSSRFSIADLWDAASDVDLKNPPPEKIWAHSKSKPSGGTRVILNFGIRRRTAQQLLRTLLEVHHHPLSAQYGHRGPYQNVLGIAHAIQTGKMYAARSDVVDFYGSFDDEKLPHELPLPKEVVDHQLVGRHLDVTVRPHTPNPSLIVSKAHQGIPPGAASSPIVGSIIVSRLDWKVPHGIVLFIYVDDFLILGPSESAVEAAAKAVSAAVAALPGGQFFLKLKTIQHATGGIDFIGHHFRLSDGVLAIHPSASKHSEFLERRTFLESDASHAVDFYSMSKIPETGQFALEQIARFWSYVLGWTQAYRAWGGALEVRLSAKSTALSLLAESGFGWADLQACMRRKQSWQWASYDS